MRKVLNHNPELVGKEGNGGARMLVNHMHGNNVLIMITVFISRIVCNTKLTL